MFHRLAAKPISCLALALAACLLVPAQAQPAFPAPAPATPFAVGAASSSSPPAVAPAATSPAPTAPGLRLHALDCGRVHLPDMGMFSDTGEYDGRPGMLVAPCFLVVHPSGTLLWDTGLGDNLAGKGAVAAEGGVVLQVDRSLQSQLQALGIEQIDYLGFSHLHFDHTGNANAFKNASWLVNRRDLQEMQGNSDAFMNPDNVRPGRQTRQVALDGDHDVFGDGTVRILHAPGHTPGHQVLLLRLARTGPVILSGDLYHTRENRKYQRVPSFNASRADSLASMNRIETLARNLGARIIIQHDPQEFTALPQVPEYLD